MKTFVIILQQSGRYWFRGQERHYTRRKFGQVICDASLENAAFYIAEGLADLYTGRIPKDAEWLEPSHPESRYRRQLKRNAERDFIIRCGIAAQPPNQ